MAFRIEVREKREKVAVALKAATAELKGNDKAQAEAGMDAALAGLSALEGGANGALVRIAGDTSPTQQNLSVSVHAAVVDAAEAKATHNQQENRV